ncbi:MAG: YraN family protein [Nitrospiraceae bacterium]|jgi:putative endonuclease
MLDPRQRVGKDGESRAEDYLRRRGYRIIQRNVKSSSGELDLIAEDRGVLVFVEVKARQTEACGGIRYAVDSTKQARIVRQAAYYLARHRIRDHPCRFDVVLVSGEESGDGSVELIQDAFQAGDTDLHC